LRSTPIGTSVCTFSIECNRFHRVDGELKNETSFFEIEAWSKLAENCYRLGHKGREVKVVGRLKQDRWTGYDGKPHSRVIVVAEHAEFKPEFSKASPSDYSNEPFPEDEVPQDETANSEPVSF
jgi:single-strand DNA-binding protein